MGSRVALVLPLDDIGPVAEEAVGGKSARLAQLKASGFKVPQGFCVTCAAYQDFIRSVSLEQRISLELNRKPFSSMRWEELWDAALRIRSAFLSTPPPKQLVQEICDEYDRLGSNAVVAVRSSAPGEDSAGFSFAGIHESFTEIQGAEEVIKAVRMVWASLWSDAALLYRQELSLDPFNSAMAVLIQEMVVEDCSGVAFGRDPRAPEQDHMIVEAVPGGCQNLVDGILDPDRWLVERNQPNSFSWTAGRREGEEVGDPLLSESELQTVAESVLRIESLLGLPPDVEWTGRGVQFCLLQARPITTLGVENEDQRAWYLELRPKRDRLNRLAIRVSQELIPELERLGSSFAEESLEEHSDDDLASAIGERLSALTSWRKTYYDDFIPFAHGVRQLGKFYNDVLKPEDPYEFVGLLSGQRMLASERNEVFQELADELRKKPQVCSAVKNTLSRNHEEDTFWPVLESQLLDVQGGETFLFRLKELFEGALDVVYAEKRLSEQPAILLSTVLELAKAPELSAPQGRDTTTAEELEERLLSSVEEGRREEAGEIIAIGRLSWRLRDDDNLLLGRLESQLLRAVSLGADRLKKAGRIDPRMHPGEKHAMIVARALRNPKERIELPIEEVKPDDKVHRLSGRQTPRQLVGQPAAPGMASGVVRTIATHEDLGDFRAGEILVCDAIQPTMTHLVPLAAAVVERRGGMLIHGAIIARELGIPCVNGIPDATMLLHNGTPVTVDGDLGIVTVGPPEFDLEFAEQSPGAFSRR